MESQSFGADGIEHHPCWPRIVLQHDDETLHHGKAAMCRTHEFKYVRRHYESDELYDLEKDPREVNNVVDDPAYADVLTHMKDRLLTWYMETCDAVPMEADQR